MNIIEHQNLHNLFDVLTPDEQLKYLVFSVNTTAFTEKFKDEIESILNDKDYIYKN